MWSVVDRSLLWGRDLLIGFLVVFPPLAHGAVEIWATTVVQLAAVTLGAIWLVSLCRSRRLQILGAPMDRPLLAFLLIAFCSAALSAHPYAGRWHLSLIVTYCAVFYVLLDTSRTARKRLRLAGLIVFSGGALAISGLTRGASDLLGFETFSQDLHGFSLTFVNHNHFAGYLGMATCLGLGLALASRGVTRAVLLALAVYMAVAVLFSLSRGGALALAGGVGFLTVGLSRDPAHRQDLYRIAGFVALVLVVAAALGWEPLLDRLETLEDPMAAGSTRLAIWRGTLDMVSEHPWHGTGPGTYVDAFRRYQPASTAGFSIHHAHNDYLELAAELGLPGLVAALGCLAVLLVQGSAHLLERSRRPQRALGLGALAACFSLSLHSLVDFNAAIPSNALLFTFCAALAVAAGRPRLDAGETARIDLRLTHRAAALIPLAVLLLWLSTLPALASPYLGSRFAREAATLTEQGEYSLAMARTRRAIELDPGNDRHSGQLADLYVTRSLATAHPAERRALLTDALEHYDRAIEQCPAGSSWWLRKAYVLERLGRDREVEEALLQAAHLAPVRPAVRHQLGRFYLRRGSREQSSAAYRRLLELSGPSRLPKVLDELWQVQPSYAAIEPAVPRNAAARRGLAGFLFDQGDTENALRELRVAFALDPTPESALIHLQSLSARRQHAAAMEAGREYLHRFGDRPGLSRHLAQIYLDLGRAEQAIPIYEDLLSRQPAATDLYLRLSRLYHRVDRAPEAARALRRGLELQPYDAELHAALARALTALNLPEEALRSFKQAIALNPEDAGSRYLLGTLYRDLGMYHHAVKTWRECLRIQPSHRDSQVAIERVQAAMNMG